MNGHLIALSFWPETVGSHVIIKRVPGMPDGEILLSVETWPNGEGGKSFVEFVNLSRQKAEDLRDHLNVALMAAREVKE